MTELIAQLCVFAFGAALFGFWLAQLPKASAVRWWFYCCVAGLGSTLLQWGMSYVLSPQVHLAFFLLVVATCYAQVGSLERALKALEHSNVVRLSLLASGFLLVTAVSAVTFSSESAAVSAGLTEDATIAVLCAFVQFSVWKYRRQNPKLVAVLFLGTTFGVLAGVLSFGAAIGILPEVLAGVPLASCGIVGAFGATLAMAFVNVESVASSASRAHTAAEKLQNLLESVNAGICELDINGRLQYANSIASEMLALPEDRSAEVWITEKLEGRDELSRKSLEELSLRPTVAGRAHVFIKNADERIAAEWSSVPAIQNGKTTGAFVTLQDSREREQAECFLRFRTEILEKIAQNKPVEEVLKLLSTAVEARLPGLSCSILMSETESFHVIASPRWPDALRVSVASLTPHRFSEDRTGLAQNRPWDSRLREIARTHGFAGTWTQSMISSANDLLGTVVLNGPTMLTLNALQGQILDEAARLGALTIEHRRWFDRLLHQGHHDALTGLPNRLLLADRVKQALSRAERKRSQLAYLCIDLDRFKYVNDTFGHDAGDLFLQQISVRLAARIRSSDTLARTGGDEFTAVICDINDGRDAAIVAESLVNALNEPFEVDGNTLFGGASIGIAVYPQDGRDIDTLQRNADRAMYRAKAQGRNGIQFYAAEEAREDIDRSDIEFHLHRAIEQGNFALHYQPQFTCDRRLCGFEALLRFNHPKLGLVPPSRFIPMAEESGLILPIGEWVLREACRQIAEWQQKGMRPVRVAVNVSPLQFTHANFAETVSRAIQSADINPEFLELEITEGVLMSSVRESSRQMAAMGELGVRLAVDDFGTGYSSLSYLHQLPINLLKIDRSFISHMLEPDGTRCIVEAIISLAHRLGLETLAEGVENHEQLAQLHAAGCNLIQGFLFSKPLSADDAAALLWQDTMSTAGAAASSKSRKTRNQPQIRLKPGR